MFRVLGIYNFGCSRKNNSIVFFPLVFNDGRVSTVELPYELINLLQALDGPFYVKKPPMTKERDPTEGIFVVMSKVSIKTSKYVHTT